MRPLIDWNLCRVIGDYFKMGIVTESEVEAQLNQDVYQKCFGSSGCYLCGWRMAGGALA